jgi:hypothetical protein
MTTNPFEKKDATLPEWALLRPRVEGRHRAKNILNLDSSGRAWVSWEIWTRGERSASYRSRAERDRWLLELGRRATARQVRA